MTIKAMMGVTAAATKAASEDFLNLNAINAQTSTTQKVAQKDMPSSTPNAVATPLPPLKPKNTGNMCPITTAMAAQATMPSGSMSQPAR